MTLGSLVTVEWPAVESPTGAYRHTGRVVSMQDSLSGTWVVIVSSKGVQLRAFTHHLKVVNKEEE